MNIVRRFLRIGASAALVLLASSAQAQATAASTSLEKCQKFAQKETAKYASQLQKAIGGCLQKIAQKVVKDDQAVVDVTAAAKTCIGQFYKIGRSDGKSLEDKMRAKIAKFCDPTHPDMKAVHTEDDITGLSSPGVNQPLDSDNIGGYCATFAAGAGTLADWLDCMEAAAECQARQQIAVEFPRALEWLDLMDTAMGASTSTKAPDAQPALQAANAAIEGATADDVPELTCGPTSGGGSGGLLVTGQTQCASGSVLVTCPGVPANVQDGDTQFGTARSYSFDTSVVGERTVIDNVTGLEWEVLCDQDPAGMTCPTDHDVDTIYPWASAFTKVADMNAANYGGHDDWRLPNRFELDSLVDLGQANPSIDATHFDASCAAPCSADACSCTASAFHWSSTTYQDDPDRAWGVFFDGGSAVLQFKSGNYRVRAVRGGS